MEEPTDQFFKHFGHKLLTPKHSPVSTLCNGMILVPTRQYISCLHTRIEKGQNRRQNSS